MAVPKPLALPQELTSTRIQILQRGTKPDAVLDQYLNREELKEVDFERGECSRQ
jgi:hypothetical protein